MAQDKVFTIKIDGIKESISNLSTLEEALSSIEKKVNTVNSNGGFTVASKESSKAMDELAKQEFSVNKSGAVVVTMMGDGSLKSVEIDNDAFEMEKLKKMVDILQREYEKLAKENPH